MFSATMVPPTDSATMIVDLRFTNEPITFFLLVYQISGIMGRGIKMLRKTWL